MKNAADVDERRRRFDKRLSSIDSTGPGDLFKERSHSLAKNSSPTKVGSETSHDPHLRNVEQIDAHAQALRRATWALKHAEPHLSLMNRPALIYDRNLGVEAFANSFRYASWTQLFHLERNGISREFFADLSSQMGLQVSSVASRLLTNLFEGSQGPKQGSLDAKASGRVAITLLRIINRTIDRFADLAESTPVQCNPWTYVGVLIDTPQLALGNTRFVEHLDLLVGADLLNAAFDEEFGDQ